MNTDLAKVVDSYIAKQEKYFHRTFNNFTKFLLRDFANTLHSGPYNQWRDQPKLQGALKVAFITEDVGHLTGGRYYAWFLICALAELGFEVTVYTNQMPVFEDSFKAYKMPKVDIVAKLPKELEVINVAADIYIGSPISGNIAATRLGKKYNKPSYALIFDPFPMMAKYLGEKHYQGWTPLVNEIKDSDTKVISLCDTTTPYVYDWLNRREDQVEPIYPCINSREITNREPGKQDYVVFISRLVKHKNFDHVLKACKSLGYRLKVISSVDGINAAKLVRLTGMAKNVDFHMKCTDAEKFEIIRNAKVVVNAAMFEGFGMWAIEALAFGIPLVCYKYPTIEEIAEYADAKNIYFADWNQPLSLQKSLQQAYEEGHFMPPCHLFDFDEMVKRVSDVFKPQVNIGVITIALNEEKFIKASLKSVSKHPNVKAVAVVEGAVNLFAHAATERGLSIDNTRDQVLEAMCNPGGEKISYIRYGWAKDKSQLRNQALKMLPEDITHVLVVDGDEVWKTEDLDRLVDAIRANIRIGVFLFPLYHFWKKKNLCAVGGQWDSRLFRCFKYTDKSLHWKLHHLPVVDANDQFINVTDGSIDLGNVHVYHYGYMKETQDVQNKIEYYKKRDGHMLPVKDTFTNWKPGDPTQPTHGGGEVAEFSGEHPPEVKGII